MTTATQFRGLAARLRYHYGDVDKVVLHVTLVRNLKTILAALDIAATTPAFTGTNHADDILTLHDTDPDT